MVKDNGFQLASFILQVSVVDTWCTLQGQKTQNTETQWKPNANGQKSRRPRVAVAGVWDSAFLGLWPSCGFFGLSALWVSTFWWWLNETVHLVGLLIPVLWTWCDGSLLHASSGVERIDPFLAGCYKRWLILALSCPVSWPSFLRVSAVLLTRVTFCVGEVKPYSLTQSLTHSLTLTQGWTKWTNVYIPHVSKKWANFIFMLTLTNTDNFR